MIPRFALLLYFFLVAVREGSSAERTGWEGRPTAINGLVAPPSDPKTVGFDDLVVFLDAPADDSWRAWAAIYQKADEGFAAGKSVFLRNAGAVAHAPMNPEKMDQRFRRSVREIRDRAAKSRVFVYPLIATLALLAASLLLFPIMASQLRGSRLRWPIAVLTMGCFVLWLWHPGLSVDRA